MCGIVGYVGDRGALPILLSALKKLEYRGYDSSGIAVLGEDKSLIVRKAKGALEFLARRLSRESIKGAIGIGHTRWATHGEPSDENAHPHTNVSGTIAVVHNGIIENYLELKAFLQERGVVFRSDTDSEVIAHLINYYYEKQVVAGESKDIYKAVRDAKGQLRGSYALEVLCRDFPDRIVVLRRDCPVLVGVGKGENFIASDVPAILEWTRDVLFLEQGDIAVVYKDHVELFNEAGSKVLKQPYHVEWDLKAAQKDGYAHFMLKEIHEEPLAVKDTLRERVLVDNTGTPYDIAFSGYKLEDYLSSSRVVIVACGTAYHAGMVAKYAFEEYARVKVEVDVASEFRYRNPIVEASDLFIVISQSGETADTLAALRLAKERGVKVVAITNCVGSSVAREADYTLYTNAGPEIAVASTKAYITQLVCLYLMAFKLAFLRGSIAKGRYISLLKELCSVPSKIEAVLANKSAIQKIASLEFNKQKVFFIGRQYDSAVSLESALKLKEVSYMHSEAFSAGELKHGPIALVDTATLVVALATREGLYDKIRSNVVEVASRKASTIVVTMEGNESFAATATAVFYIPKIEEGLSPIISVIPSQLFAYYCAVQRGCDPDKPRNLAKSVTVE